MMAGTTTTLRELHHSGQSGLTMNEEDEEEEEATVRRTNLCVGTAWKSATTGFRSNLLLVRGSLSSGLFFLFLRRRQAHFCFRTTFYRSLARNNDYTIMMNLYDPQFDSQSDTKLSQLHLRTIKMQRSFRSGTYGDWMWTPGPSYPSITNSQNSSQPKLD